MTERYWLEPDFLWLDAGDIVEHVDGRILEVTSGNLKWQTEGNDFLRSINCFAVRAKEHNPVPKTLWDLADMDRDWYVYQREINRKLTASELELLGVAR